jgi:hypothetical protein
MGVRVLPFADFSPVKDGKKALETEPKPVDARRL